MRNLVTGGMVVGCLRGSGAMAISFPFGMFCRGGHCQVVLIVFHIYFCGVSGHNDMATHMYLQSECSPYSWI